MAKQGRHNIDTIANVLIDKLEDMEKTAVRIEKAANQPLQVDLRRMEEIFNDKTNKEEAVLRDLSELRQKNKGRVPNWIITLLCAFFLISVGISLYAWKKAEQYDQQKTNAEHFQRLYYESQEANTNINN